MRLLILCAALLLSVVSSLHAATPPVPKVRTITAFIQLDRSRYEQQVADTLKMLREAKASMELSGYNVQTIRITTQPFPAYMKGLSKSDALAFMKSYSDLAVREGFDASIGSAMLNDNDDPSQAELLGEILSTTKGLNGSLVIADSKGVHWKGIAAAAKIIQHLKTNTTHSLGTFKFAAIAMVGPYTPFFPGSYHVGTGKRFSIGLQSANVVIDVFGQTRDPALATQKLTEALEGHAKKIERIANQIAKKTGWTYQGLDPTPVFSREDQIGSAIEKFTGAKFGSSGTLTTASIITKAIKAVKVKQVGYAGLMLPVLEDPVLAQRWSEGTYSIDSLLAYSAVCGTGLDTVPLPGDVSNEQLERILGDVASLAFKWNKPLTGRLQPILGKKEGERTEFNDPFLVNAVLRPLP